ncbi:MAG: PH domain-containing protein [Candidatus Bathyarchaeota archaeon]|nr:PH domain-containing protein [Candidatus Bathyarchaeota archaeon]
MVLVKEFGADVQLIKLYQTYLAITLLCGFLSWIIPLTVGLVLIGEALAGIIVALSVLAPLLIVVAIASYWIPRFHISIKYYLEDDELVVRKGVWWKTKSVVPYNRITNVNTYQGPISRRYGIGRLSIQTAGFSGASSSGYKTGEAEIFGVKDFEEVKDVIMNFVKGVEPVAVEAKADPAKNVNQEMLKELRRIREAVEK